MDEECHNFLMLSVNNYELNVLVAAVIVYTLEMAYI